MIFRTRHKIIGAIFVLIVGVFGVSYAAHKNIPVTLKPTPPFVVQPSILVTPITGTPAGTSNCEPSLWTHVYNPQRLHVIEPCKTVTGTVEVIRIEKDGDYHILVNVDTAYKSMLNQVNVDKQRGDLVIEPICENPVSQQDVLDQGVCNGFSQNIHLTVGEHISITGAYVLDSEHGWVELHPITKVEKL